MWKGGCSYGAHDFVVPLIWLIHLTYFIRLSNVTFLAAESRHFLKKKQKTVHIQAGTQEHTVNKKLLKI